MIKLDFDYEGAAQLANVSNPPPDGDYTLQVQGVTAERNDGSSLTDAQGGALLRWDFVVVDDPDQNGRRVPYFTPLQDKDMIWKLVRVTEALGEPWQGTELNTEAYVGKTCKASVNNYEDKQGRKQAGIKKFLG